MRTVAVLGCCVCAGPRATGGGADLSVASDQGDHPGERRRHPGRVHARARRGSAQAVRADAGDREPAGRQLQHRRARLRGLAARRLHHLHAAERGAGLQPVPVQEDCLRSGEGFRADHQSVLLDPGDRGECRSQGEQPRGARGAVASEAEDPELHRARAAALGIHGEFQEAHRRRHGAGAVPRRRRDHQRRALGHDAGGVLRALELGVVPAGRDGRRTGGRFSADGCR